MTSNENTFQVIIPKGVNEEYAVSLRKTLGYLQTRYSVRLAYDCFTNPGKVPNTLFYKCFNGYKDVLFVYHKYGPNAQYISIETEPEYLCSISGVGLESESEYLESLSRKLIGFNKFDPFRKNSPCLKMEYDDYETIKESLEVICDSIDEYFHSDNNAFSIAEYSDNGEGKETDSTLFYRQLKKNGLDTPQGWKGEYRDRLFAMLNPIIEGTDYYLVKNFTDTKNGYSKLTELWKTGIKKRRMGFEYKKTLPDERKIHSFFNNEFYEELKIRMPFPKMDKFRNNQPFFSWSLVGLWNLFCVVTGKNNYLVNSNESETLVTGAAGKYESVDADSPRSEDIQKKKDAETVSAIEKELDHLDLHGEDREAVVKVRVNQGKFRDILLHRYSKCCLCGVSDPSLLTASHIKPWSASEPDEKLDVDNGFLLCPNHDKLFDKGFISFTDEGKIMVSPLLSERDRTFTNVNPNVVIDLTDKNREYLAFHRDNVFKR